MLLTDDIKHHNPDVMFGLYSSSPFASNSALPSQPSLRSMFHKHRTINVASLALKYHW
jgi:hypothetical protein